MRIISGRVYSNIWLNDVLTEAPYNSGHNSVVGYQSLVDQTQTDKICLGRVEQSGWRLFKGMIQDFVLWNRTLSNIEVQKIIDYYKGQGMF